MAPLPKSPNPDPFATLGEALVSIAECFADNAAIAAYIRRVKCDDPSWSDMVALTSLAIAAALCEAANEDPSCCEADPFVVENLEVAIDAQVGDLTTKGPVNIAEDVNMGGTMCAPKLFKRNLIPSDKLVSIDAPGGPPYPCMFLFPQSDLLLGPDLFLDYLTVGGTAVFGLHLNVDGHNLTVGKDMTVGGFLHAAWICGLDLQETDFTEDAQLVVTRSPVGFMSCLEGLAPGVCCHAVTGCCPPTSFDPLAIGFPGGFPVPPGTNLTCEMPLYSADDNPAPDDPYPFFCSQMTTSGALVDSGYDPGITFGTIGANPCTSFLGIMYYVNGAATWTTTLPDFATWGNDTFYTVICYAVGYVVLFSSLDPGHEYTKPNYNGGIFDPHNLCPPLT